MEKIVILAFIFLSMLFVVNVYAFEPNGQPAFKEEIPKWKKFVVHIAGVNTQQETTSIELANQYMIAFANHFLNGKPMDKDIEDNQNRILELRNKHLEQIYYGTGILIHSQKERYLVTARHALHNIQVAAANKARHIKECNDAAVEVDPAFVQREDCRLYPKILMLPIGLVRGGRLSKVTQLLNSQTIDADYLLHPYSFHDKVDLAIVSLQESDENAALNKWIDDNGFQFVSVDEIAEPSAEGAEVFAVGFPVASSRNFFGLKHIIPDIDEAMAINLEFFSALHVSTFGRIAQLSELHSSFLLDLRASEGTSGGPVIENGKLVGVITSEPRTTVKGMSEENIPAVTRVPMAWAEKASYIKDLVAVQKEKDKRRAEIRRAKP